MKFEVRNAHAVRVPIGRLRPAASDGSGLPPLAGVWPSVFGLRLSVVCRRLLAVLLATLLCLPGTAAAHSGTQNVFYEGNIGPYAARVIIKRPDVVPGLAEITIRMLKGTPDDISVLPLKWNLGRKGAPTPDVAQPVRGEEQLYHAQLWFMESGSQSVEVSVKGAAGQASIQIPVAVVPTKVETMPPGLGTILLLLGALLVLILLGIVRGAVRESVLPAGETVSARRAWMARAAVLVAFLLLATGLWIGGRWWNAEARDYLNRRLYKPMEGNITARLEGGQRILRIELPEQELRSRSPIVPDHGKLMHLVLVRFPHQNVLAHLHPLKLNRRTFAVAVPDIPAGPYVVYAEVTYETGFAENITGRVEIPERGGDGGLPAAGLRLDKDPDDAWCALDDDAVTEIKEGRRIADLGDGLVMEWLDSKQVTAGGDMSMHFQVRDAAGRPVKVGYYMGMLGHLFIRSEDGHLFTHLHPAGSFSMASQQLFDLRAQGKAPSQINFGALEPTCKVPTVEESIAYWDAQKSAGADYSVSFPWQFTEPGQYRLWVQMRVAGTIRTGVFDVTVRQPSS